MTVPYREWFLFQHLSFLRSSSDNSEDRPHWAGGKYEYGLAGQWGAAGPVYSAYKAIARPLNDFDYDDVNLNLLVDIECDILLTPYMNSGATVHCHLDFGAQANPASPALWDSVLADGVYYDGINNWCLVAATPFYPTGNTWSTHLEQINIPVSLINHRNYGCSYKAGLGPEVWMSKYEYEHHGLCLNISSFAPADPVPVGESCVLTAKLKRLRYLYLNPVVNSLSRPSMPAAGGVALVLTGLGFNNTDAEVSDVAKNPNNAIPPAGGWNDAVYHIQFIGMEGQGTYLFHGGHPPAPTFSVDSNTQITIPSMPALPEGSYEIYLIKDQLNLGGGFGGFGPGYAYAGDWRAETSGRLYRGTRLIFYSGVPGPGKRKPTIFTKWRWKKYGGGVDRYYAPIDTITPKIFYDGRILSMSALQRQISDRGGLFTSSDMQVELANHDFEFSKLLAQYFLKNQVVEIFYGWADQPEAWKTAAAVLIADDYSRAGPSFNVQLRDITTKYFKCKVPAYRCTLEEYPNLHKNALNRPMPEVVGKASLMTAGNGGAVEAICVDTVTHQYLAARGSLHAVTEVYADGVLYSAAGYAVGYGADGRTYITFTSDMEDKKITFNAEGYMYAEWDSIGGFVQNPAYVMLFYLGFLVGVPEEFLDFDAFDALADMFALEGESTSGYLVLQREQDSDTILQEQLFTMGALSSFDRTGRFHVERKGLSVLGTSLFVFSQIDTLGFPSLEYNLKSAFNRARYRWQYCPGQEVYVGGDEATRPSSIDDFEEELESPQPIDFPWTSSSAWAAKRAEEEMQKWGYGSPDIKFGLPVAWVDDMDVLTDFRLQDPFGTSLTGSGEYGRYCYISSLTLDVSGMKLDIIAKDLNWLLRQYLILGDENDLPDNWVSTTDEQRIFAYLCDEVTGRFADGEPGKKLVDENMV